jgi:hypothetical protein
MRVLLEKSMAVETAPTKFTKPAFAGFGSSKNLP